MHVATLYVCMHVYTSVFVGMCVGKYVCVLRMHVCILLCMHAFRIVGT